MTEEVKVLVVDEAGLIFQTVKRRERLAVIFDRQKVTKVKGVERCRWCCYNEVGGEESAGSAWLFKVEP